MLARRATKGPNISSSKSVSICLYSMGYAMICLCR